MTVEPIGRGNSAPPFTVLYITSVTTLLFQAGGRFRALCLTLDVSP
jgi:hypothetical protein